MPNARRRQLELLLALLLTDRLASLFRLHLNRLPIFDLIDFRLKALREELSLWFETIPLAQNASFFETCTLSCFAPLCRERSHRVDRTATNKRQQQKACAESYAAAVI
jgi:hypothetical protein